MLSENSDTRAVTRLDHDGYLYYMDYTRDYYSPAIREEMKAHRYISGGCSVFFTHNPLGQPITCRNYDFPHRVSDEDQTLTGLNFVVHCKPEGKYESISVADAVWHDEHNPLFQRGGPDRPDFDIRQLDLLPYLCMDGVNEMGLCGSILIVAIKEGDRPGKLPYGPCVLLRYILDSCAAVSEAVQLIKTSEITPEDWQSCHLFLTDAQDHHAVIESRNGRLTVTETDIVTNFYVSYDDMADYYRDGALREKAVKITDQSGDTRYRFGYGYGYHRFVTIASQLESRRDTASEQYRTVMPESSALVILRSAIQSPETNAVGISLTQYTAIYNNAEKTVEVWASRDYNTSWAFDVTGKRR